MGSYRLANLLDCAVCGTLGRHFCRGGRYVRVKNTELIESELAPAEIEPWPDMHPIGVTKEQAFARFGERLKRWPR